MCLCVHVCVIWLFALSDMLCPYVWSSFSAYLHFPYGVSGGEFTGLQIRKRKNPDWAPRSMNERCVYVLKNVCVRGFLLLYGVNTDQQVAFEDCVKVQTFNVYMCKCVSVCVRWVLIIMASVCWCFRSDTDKYETRVLPWVLYDHIQLNDFLVFFVVEVNFGDNESCVNAECAGSYLHPGLGEFGSLGELLPGVDVRVVGSLKGPLQLL